MLLFYPERWFEPWHREEAILRRHLRGRLQARLGGADARREGGGGEEAAGVSGKSGLQCFCLWKNVSSDFWFCPFRLKD